MVVGQVYGHMHTNQYRVWSRDDWDDWSATELAVMDGAAPPKDDAETSPPLLVFSAISPIFGNSPSFSVLHLRDADDERARVRLDSVATYHADFSAPPEGATAPRFQLLYNTSSRFDHWAGQQREAITPAAAHSMSNGLYSLLAASFAADDASWDLFHTDFAANGSMSSDRACTTDAADDAVGDCKVCSGGCRLAWICLLTNGLSRAEYERCVADAIPIRWEGTAAADRLVIGSKRAGGASLAAALAITLAAVLSIGISVWRGARRRAAPAAHHPPSPCASGSSAEESSSAEAELSTEYVRLDGNAVA